MRFLVFVTVVLVACSPDEGGPRNDTSDIPQPGFEPPVITNPESPVSYPPALYDDGVEGSVVLQLFVNEEGEIVPDSSQIAEGSGYAALDSAALAGISTMRFAPARRNGSPVATSFLQPIHFRLPEGGTGGG
jgi:TonB family protein